jgi:hypothetical protein
MKERCDLMRRALPPGARSSRAASAVPIFPAYADDVYGLQMGSYRTLPRTRVDGSEGGGATGTYLEHPPTPESINGVTRQRRRLTRGRRRRLAATGSNPRICGEELGSARARASSFMLSPKASMQM